MSIAEQATKITGPLSGVATIWALDLGLRSGTFTHLRDAGPSRPGQVAEALALDSQYTAVLLRAAYAAEILERDGERYRLADDMDVLLLEPDSGLYLGGAIRTFVALRETFLDLRTFLSTKEREWWNDFDPEWIDAVGENGQTYYRRLVDIVIPQLPRVHEALSQGARYLDLACGVCRGPAKLLRAYPKTTLTAVDADGYTLEVAAQELKAAGLDDRCTLTQAYLEQLDLETEHDVAVINISLHEARDIERAVERAYAALAPGGTFLVSEFPFPENEEECRSVPGRLMCGVQFFEAHIGCQLLPTSRFVELLTGAGFTDVAAIPVTPMHVVIHGTK